jgi:glutamate dehydrogenase/leucine dehydrogenase
MTVSVSPWATKTGTPASRAGDVGTPASNGNVPYRIAPHGAIDAVQMLGDRPAPEAQELTVHGDTETAMFAALWLAEQGRKVTLSSPSTDVGLDTNGMQRNHLKGAARGPERHHCWKRPAGNC